MDFPESVKLAAKTRAHYCCAICRRSVFLHVHHITPQEEGGPANLDNAAPLCVECHDLYGMDAGKRKWVREARDFWWEYCATQESHPDTIALRERIDALQVQVRAGHQELLSELKTTLTDAVRRELTAISSARTVPELIQATSGLSASVQVGGRGHVTEPILPPSTHS